MTTEPLKTLARHFIDTIDRQDWPAVTDLTVPAMRVYIGSQELDRNAWLGMGQMFAAAFPDGKHEIQDLIAEGDQVVVRGVWRGTQKGTFQGIPASGRSVQLGMIMIERFVEGRVVEHVAQFDVMSLMQQIGPVPAG